MMMQLVTLLLLALSNTNPNSYQITLPNGLKINAEIAKDKQKGLQGRKSLCPSCGMIFIFEREGLHGFWMKDTLIPLSIAFIDREGRIVRIEEMEALTLESHLPPKPVLYALEMRRGWFSANGIKPGEVLRFSR